MDVQDKDESEIGPSLVFFVVAELSVLFSGRSGRVRRGQVSLLGRV